MRRYIAMFTYVVVNPTTASEFTDEQFRQINALKDFLGLLNDKLAMMPVFL